MSSVRKAFPAKVRVNFDPTGALPTTSHYKSSLVLNKLKEIHGVLELIVVNNVCVVKVWSNVCLVHLVENWTRSESGKEFKQPKAFIGLLNFLLDV